MKNGVNSHLEALFLKHYKEWCLLAFSYLENLTDAEEVVQDVCVRVLFKEKDVTISNLKGYIFKAIKNNCLKRLRQRKRFQKLTEFNTAAIPSMEEHIIFAERRVQLQQIMESLPEQCKLIFELCVIEGQKYQSVADTLGVSKNTVKYHIKNAYKTLRLQTVNIHVVIALQVPLLF